MTGTTEMDLKEVVRDLFEQIVREINADYGDMEAFAALVEDEEEIYLWFGGESAHGDEAKYTARASYEADENRIDFSLHTVDGFSRVFYKLKLESPLAGRRLTFDDLGPTSREAVKAFFEELARRAGLEKFVYEVRKSFL